MERKEYIPLLKATVPVKSNGGRFYLKIIKTLNQT